MMAFPAKFYVANKLIFFIKGSFLLNFNGDVFRNYELIAFVHISIRKIELTVIHFKRYCCIFVKKWLKISRGKSL